MTHLSLTHKRWHIPDQSAASDPLALVPLLMKARDLSASDQTGSLADPRLMPQLPRAVERITSAIASGEMIGIFGDYDCDGITGTAQLVRYCRRHGCEPVVRLPHRVHDGYGLNQKIVDEFCQAGVQLLLTVDTGIASAAEIAQLNATGVDVIVTDHHHVPAELPPAYAIVHPVTAPEYPLPYPAGAGVVYQLLRALEPEPWPEQATDCALAMIGTIADVVELRGDNRTLVQQGLKALRALPADQPISQLIDQAGLDHHRVTSTDVAFRLAPRINAAGRLDDPHRALQALLNGGDELAALDALNQARQSQTQDLYAQLLKSLPFHGQDPAAAPPLLSAASAEYPPGIIGLLAGKLTEQFGRPSVVAAIDGDTCTASLRSPASYHITEGLERCRDLIDRFGGHAQAAGCTLPLRAWEPFCQQLQADIAARVPPDDLIPLLAADAVVDPRDVTLSLCQQLQHLEPFGQGNREPVFLLRNVTVEAARCVGADGHHLQARVAGLKAIGFGLGQLLPHCNDRLDVLCRLGIDTWNGTQAPQLVVVDMRETQPIAPVSVTDSSYTHPTSSL